LVLTLKVSLEGNMLLRSNFRPPSYWTWSNFSKSWGAWKVFPPRTSRLKLWKESLCHTLNWRKKLKKGNCQFSRHKALIFARFLQCRNDDLISHRKSQATHWLRISVDSKIQEVKITCELKRHPESSHWRWWANKYFRFLPFPTNNRKKILQQSQIVLPCLKCLICLGLLTKLRQDSEINWDEERNSFFSLYWFSQQNKRSNRIN
jgi:hypothetical protein